MIKTKTDLKADIDSVIVGGGNISASDLNTILNNVVDSYEDIIQQYNQTAINALTPTTGQKV